MRSARATPRRAPTTRAQGVRCLHVGNVTGSVTADIMRAFINAAMHKENFAAAPGEVIIRIDPLPEKCA